MSESDEGRGRRSEINFLHDKRNVSISNGLKIVHEEYIIDGEKGLMIKFYHKEGDNFNKVTVKALGDGNYKFISSRNDEDKREETLSKKDLLEELKKSKMLKFALDYLDKQKGGAGESNRSGSRGPSNRSGSKGPSNRSGSKGPSNRSGSRGPSNRSGSKGTSRNNSRTSSRRNQEYY